MGTYKPFTISNLVLELLNLIDDSINRILFSESSLRQYLNKFVFKLTKNCNNFGSINFNNRVHLRNIRHNLNE